MKRFMNSAVYRIFDYLARLVLLNLLNFLVSLSFLLLFIDDAWSPLVSTLVMVGILSITFFPAIIATFSVIKGYEDGKTTAIFKPYFLAFKKYYLKTLGLGIILLVSAFLLTNSLFVFYNNYQTSVANMVGFYLTIAIILVFILSVVHLPIMIVHFDDLSIMQYIKLSITMGFKDIIFSFLMLVVVAVTIMSSITVPFIMAIGGFSIPVFLLVKITYRRYIKISNKYEKERNDEN